MFSLFLKYKDRNVLYSFFVISLKISEFSLSKEFKIGTVDEASVT
ncbi:MAG: hypothetical protein ACRDDY_08535 [Clostridium sp.]